MSDRLHRQRGTPVIPAAAFVRAERRGAESQGWGRRRPCLLLLLALTLAACSGTPAAPATEPAPVLTIGPAPSQLAETTAVPSQGPAATREASVAPPEGAPSGYAEYAEGFCVASLAMVRAIGNPDTGADSELSFALKQAIEQGDLATAAEVADQMRAELRTARAEATRVAGWSEGAAAAQALDRFLAAFEVSIDASLKAAPQGLEAAQLAGQQALEAEGAFDSYISMLEAMSALASGDGRGLLDCGIPPDPRNP